MSATQTYSERLQSVLAETQEAVGDDLARLIGPPEGSQPDETPAPAEDTGSPPATTPTPAPKADESKPDATRSDSPEGDDDTPVTLTRKELAARIEEETKRQRNDQSRLAKEAQEAREERDRLRAERDTLADRTRALDETRRVVREAQREGRAVDVDDVTDWATREVETQREAVRQQERERQETLNGQAAIWQNERDRRSHVAATIHADTVARVMELGQTHGVAVTRAEAAQWIVDGYTDQVVQQDIADWQSPEISAARADARIKAAFTRIQEQSVAKVSAKAVANVNAERPAPREYNRVTASGEPGGTTDTWRHLSPRERLNQALQEANDQTDKDLKKFLG